MFLFTVPETEVKNFMGVLFKETTFDKFDVRGVEIITFTKFEISSILSTNENEERSRNFCKWEELRPYCFDIIKGKQRPRQIKIVFSLNNEETESLHNNISTFMLNMLYNGGEITFTTATSQKTFDLDKSGEEVWGDYVKGFFKDNNIAVLHEKDS